MVSKKILLVEDEALIALSEARILEKHGLEVSIVHSGEKAIEAIALDPDISLILMDIDLGNGIDGTETAEIILEQHDLPVVFLSSHTEPAIVSKTERITSYGYIVKNSGETVLLASIKVAFRLWESEDKFRKAFEYTSVGMVLTAPTGEFLRVNKAFAAMLGYTMEEILSLNFSNLTHPDDVEMSIAQLKTMLAGKTDHSRFTKRYIRKNGGVVWADVNSMLLRNSEGMPIHFVTHAQDITESKLMQEELDRQREQYDLLLRSVPTPILVAQDGKYVYSNPSAAELLGYASAQELIGTPIEHTISAGSQKRIQHRMKNIQAGLKNPAVEIDIYRRDGKTLCCESTSMPITFNSSPAALIISRDLTAQKKAEAELKESRDKIASILKAAPTGIGVVQGREKRIVIEANEKLCAMTGYTREELIGEPARIFYASQEDFEYVGLEKYRQIDAQGSGSVETRWKKKDGTIIQVLLASSPIHSSDISLGVTFTAMDITEVKQVEADLRKALDQKDFLMRELNHRIKNNLSMVSSLISLKDSEIDSDLSDLKHRIDTIRLVHEKLQQYKDIEKIEVKDYFQEILETLFTSSTDKDVHIVNTIESVTISTKTAIALGLIINEIATNAIKYGFTSEEEARFTVSMAEDKENHLYNLSLSNSGNPFPDDIDIENTETSGLQLISILVQQLGGTLQLEKRPSSKFTLRFPVENP